MYAIIENGNKQYKVAEGDAPAKCVYRKSTSSSKETKKDFDPRTRERKKRQ